MRIRTSRGYFNVSTTYYKYCVFFRAGLRDCDGIRRNPTNPFYVTTYDDYGYFSPTVHTARRCYHGKPQQFGQQQFIRGMYRDHSLNMWMYTYIQYIILWPLAYIIYWKGFKTNLLKSVYLIISLAFLSQIKYRLKFINNNNILSV